MSAVIEIANQPGRFVKVDYADWGELLQYRWLVYARKSGYEYAVAQVAGKRTYMHRLLCGQPGLVVDHINGDTLDNRRANLRAVSNRENTRNHNTAPKSNCGVRNVRLQGGSYVAKVNVRYLGSFASVDAAQAVVDAARASAGNSLDLCRLVDRLYAENAQLRARVAELEAAA